jgi:putative Mg2+ transporter-C (MgtC) family protein
MSEADLCLRLLVAAGLGLVLGAEREALHKPAGLRTHLVVCTAAALLTASSLALGEAVGARGEALRVAAGVVTGIGFVGAGAILQTRRRVVGLTTAATIFMSAAIGIAVGAGFYVLAGTATAITIASNLGLGFLEQHLSKRTDSEVPDGEPRPRRVGRPTSPRSERER